MPFKPGYHGYKFLFILLFIQRVLSKEDTVLG